MTVASSAKTSKKTARNWLRILGILFAVLGLLVAAYMSWAELTGQETACPGNTGDMTGEAGKIAVDCGFVQHSIYAKVFGIPVALLGLGGYLAILTVWLFEDRNQILAEYSRMLVFGMALFGFLFSAYLTYTELFIMYTICSWCITSAVLMTLVFIVATIQLVQYFRQPMST